MKNLSRFIGFIALAAMITFSMIACDDGKGSDTGDGDDPLDKLPVAERWSKYEWESTATLDQFSVSSDGVVTVTIGGTPEPQGQNNQWRAWRIRARYAYTSKVNTSYIYEIEAWKAPDSGDRTLIFQYYENNDTQIYLSKDITLTEEPTTYTVRGQKIPGRQDWLDFQCAHQLGTFYIKILGIYEYTPSLQYELIDDEGSPNDGTYRLSSATGMSGAVNIPATYNGQPVTVIGEGAFSKTDIISVTIPASVTSIEGWAFQDCINLTSVTFAAGSQLEYIGWYAFGGCTSLTGITIPENVYSIFASFYGSRNLVAITVADGNLRYTSASGILYNKDKTEIVAYPSASGNVTIPAGVTVIGGAAFRECKSLTGVTIPSSVTRIGWHAFLDCTGITSITIPASVEAMGWVVFAGWTASQTINIVGYSSQSAADAAWPVEYEGGEIWRTGCNAKINYLGQ